MMKIAKSPTVLFPGQNKDENVLMVIRRHWFTYIFFWIISFAMILPLIGGIVYISYNYAGLESDTVTIMLLIGSAYTLSVLGLLLYGFIDFYLDIYILTDRRIVDIKQNGFFNRTISELNLHQIQDVRASVKGIFPTMLHFGQVYIQTAGEIENFDFRDVPHPYRISKLILDLHNMALHNERRELEEGEARDAENLQQSMKDVDEEEVKRDLKQLQEPIELKAPDNNFGPVVEKLYASETNNGDQLLKTDAQIRNAHSGELIEGQELILS